MRRRALLKTTVQATALTALGAAGLLPRLGLAEWPTDAFHAEELDAVLTDLFGDQVATDSDKVKLTAPDIAENGRVVPVEVAIDLPAPKALVLLSDGNPFPLLARAHFTPDVEPRVSIRVKMGQSANLIALVEADGNLHRATRAVKVTAGGCGG